MHFNLKLSLFFHVALIEVIFGQINWQQGAGGVEWAPACDFNNHDLSSARIPGEQCGEKCIGTKGCNHFAWTNYQGGTCWMKTGNVQKSDAKFNGNYEMVCGIVSSSKPTILWSDEFNYNGAPDGSKWNIVNAGGGFGNNEAQFYTPQNVKVGGGYLTITARKQNWGGNKYTSGKLESKYDFTYGIFEMRAKIPQGRGTWSAFWLVNGQSWPLNGEIDIMGT